MNELKCADQILSLTESRAIKTVQTIVGANQEGSNSIFDQDSRKDCWNDEEFPQNILWEDWHNFGAGQTVIENIQQRNQELTNPKCQNVWHCFSSLMTKENTRSKGGLQSFGSAAVDAGRRADWTQDLFCLTTMAALVQHRCSAHWALHLCF